MEKITHQGNIIEVVQTEVEVKPGIFKTFEKARRAPGTRLIIPTASGIMLTKEFRPELNDYDYRLPGGKVFDSLEEYNNFLATKTDILEPATAKAKAEAQEEVGIVVNNLSHLHTSRLGATIEWDLYYFVVSDYELSEQALELGEDIEVQEVSLDEAQAMCLDGRIDEERSALVLLRYLKEDQ